MANSKGQKAADTHPAFHYAKLCAAISEDVSRSVLGFVPNGLNDIYQVIKQSPFLGGLFKHPWVDQVVKICSGIIIGQGIASDLAHFLFRPIGFMIGFLIGSSIKQAKSVPTYQGQIGRVFQKLAGPTVGCALMAMLVYWMAHEVFPDLFGDFVGLKALILFAASGAALGFLGQAILLYAIYYVNASNQNAIKGNVQKAKELSQKLKVAAKQAAKSRILMQAQDIIQQMNGPQAQQHLDEFFREQYEQISASTDKQIERHFNYLTDRACHGDAKALARLQMLNQAEKPAKKGSKMPLESMLDRLFNQRAILKLKDDVDTIYDRWQYRMLRA